MYYNLHKYKTNNKCDQWEMNEFTNHGGNIMN